MRRIEASITIDTPPRTVFAVATLPAKMSLWMSSVLLTSFTTGDAVAVGTRFQQQWKLLGCVLQTSYEVVEYAPDQAFAYQSIAGPLCCFVRGSFAPLDTRTRVGWCSDLDLRAVFPQQTRLAARVAQRLLEVDLLALRAVLERDGDGNNRCLG